MTRQTALPATLAPRLISREAAAAYIGISPSKFDELVRDKRMPLPKRIDARKVWDVRQLDAAADNLPVDCMSAADDSWGDVDAP